jgi:hypothetical protein
LESAAFRHAGARRHPVGNRYYWIPAFARMTVWNNRLNEKLFTRPSSTSFASIFGRGRSFFREKKLADARAFAPGKFRDDAHQIDAADTCD